MGGSDGFVGWGEDYSTDGESALLPPPFIPPPRGGSEDDDESGSKLSAQQSANGFVGWGEDYSTDGESALLPPPFIPPPPSPHSSLDRDDCGISQLSDTVQSTIRLPITAEEEIGNTKQSSDNEGQGDDGNEEGESVTPQTETGNQSTNKGKEDEGVEEEESSNHPSVQSSVKQPSYKEDNESQVSASQSLQSSPPPKITSVMKTKNEKDTSLGMVQTKEASADDDDKSLGNGSVDKSIKSFGNKSEQSQSVKSVAEVTTKTNSVDKKSETSMGNKEGSERSGSGNKSKRRSSVGNQSEYTADSDGFMGWGTKSSDDCSSSSVNDGKGQDSSIRDATDRDDSNNNDITVDFPEDRTPFQRRASVDGGLLSRSGSFKSNHSAHSGSKDKLGGSEGVISTGNDEDNTINHNMHENETKSLRESLRKTLSKQSASFRKSLQSELNSGGGGGGDDNVDTSPGMLIVPAPALLGSPLSRSRANSRSRSNSRDSKGVIRRPSLKEQRRPSLRELNDDAVGALPILGWDDTGSYSSNGSSLLSKSINMSYKTRKKKKKRISSGGSVLSGLSHASYKASQFDTYSDGDGLCEEFVSRDSFHRVQSDPGQLDEAENDKANRDLLMPMMEEEYDARKPWLKAPPGGGTVVVKSKTQQGDQPRQRSRRATGVSMQSSFTSDIFHDEFMERPPPIMSNEDEGYTAVVAAEKETLSNDINENLPPAPSAVTHDEGSATDDIMGAKASSIQEKGEAESPSITSNGYTANPHHRMSVTSACEDVTLTSALSDDDDGSELTELREAQEALFPVPESVRSVSSAGGRSYDGDDCSASERSDTSSHFSRELDRAHATATELELCMLQSKELSSLDIVQEDRESDQFNQHPQQRHKLPPVSESGSQGGDEHLNDENSEQLDDPLTSSKNDLPKRRTSLSKLDDDSVSYSDIDGESGVPAPSIKMCMTVQDSMIEREFNTEQLDDVSFGETKGTSPFDEDGEMTLQDLLEGPNEDEMDDDSYRPIDDSARLGDDDNKSSSNKSMKSKSSFPKFSLKKKSSSIGKKLDTKATKKLRRKNKRMWKFCVWNCKKITFCLVLGLCLLIGISIVSWWGAKQATKSSDDGMQDVVEVQNDGNAIVEGEPSQFPSMSPSLRGSAMSVMGTTQPSTLPPSYESSSVPSISSSGSSTVDALSSGMVSSTSPVASPSIQPLYLTSDINETLSPSTQNISLSPSITSVPSSVLDSNNSSLNASTFPTLSQSPSSNSLYDNLTYPSSSPSHLEFPSSNPSNNLSFLSEPPSLPNSEPNETAATSYPSLSPSIFNITSNESVYQSIQTVTGMKQFEYTGSSVAISPTGEFIAVGFKEANSASFDKTGLVRVYQRGDNSTYSPLGQDSMFGRASGDEFGASVSISNDGMRVAVGARSSSSPDKNKNGEVTIFTYSDASNSWNELGSSIQGNAEKERLGWAVSMSGDGKRVAFGVPRGNGGTGSASVYEYNGLDWILLKEVVGDDINDRFGFSTAISNDGNTLVVGAFSSSKGGISSSGSVTIYSLDDSAAGRSKVLVGDTLDGRFGYSVSVSSDGNRVAVGSSGFSTSSISRSGLCEVYEEQRGEWTKIGSLVGTEMNEEAGTHVAISQNGNIVSCSKNTSNGGTKPGMVTILREEEEGWNVVDTVTTSLGNSTASFGASVSLSQDGKIILVGAPSYNSSAGFFQLFSLQD